MAKRELTARYLFFIAGLFVNAFGISLIIKANLGSSPISSLPYTLSLKFPITLGQFTLLLNAVLIAGQIALLKKDFRKEQFLQIPVAILFTGDLLDGVAALILKYTRKAMPVGASTTCFFFVFAQIYFRKVDLPVPALPVRNTD